MRNVTCGFAVAALAILGSTQAQANEQSSVRSEYVVSLHGLVLARSNVESHIDRRTFRIQATMRSAGFGSIFDNTRGVTTVKGQFAQDATRPDSYEVDYTSGKKKKNTRIDFSNGAVVKAVNDPPVNTKRADWVPVQKAHLAGVADPLSATLVRAESPAQVCNRTIAFFDGAMRADIALSSGGNGNASIPGYEGETIVCNARFLPVSGYRKNNSSIGYLRNASRITIAFAPVGTTGVYAPIEASVSTQIGTIRVRARRFEEMG